MNQFERNFKPLDLLSDEQVERILNKTLQVLQDSGVVFKSKQALELFERTDCNWFV